MGKIGDVIYSLPTIRELGGGILYLPESTPDGCSNLYSGLKELLLLQPYIKEVREYPSGLAYREKAPGIHIDFDMDDARLQPNKGLTHIVKRYMDQFGVKVENWKQPWLKVPSYSVENRWLWHNMPKEYCLINYTGRHIKNDQLGITSKVNWKKVVDSIEYPVFFVGLFNEYTSFCETFNVHLPWIKTNNMLQLARFVKDAKAVYCNQSSVLALSQALGIEYHLEVKPHKRNCLLATNNEYILL